MVATEEGYSRLQDGTNRKSLSRKMRGVRRKVIGRFLLSKAFRKSTTTTASETNEAGKGDNINELNLVNVFELPVEIDNENDQATLLRRLSLSSELMEDKSVAMHRVITHEDGIDEIEASFPTLKAGQEDATSDTTETDESSIEEDSPSDDGPNEQEDNEVAGKKMTKDHKSSGTGKGVVPPSLWQQFVCGAITLPADLSCTDGNETQVASELLMVPETQDKSNWSESPSDDLDDSSLGFSAKKKAGALAWLGSPVDRQVSEVSTRLRPVERPVRSLPLGEMSPKAEEKLQVLQEETDLDEEELAKRQWHHQYLQLSAQRLMQEQESTRKLETDPVNVDHKDDKVSAPTEIIHLKISPLKKQGDSFEENEEEGTVEEDEERSEKPESVTEEQDTLLGEQAEVNELLFITKEAPKIGLLKGLEQKLFFTDLPDRPLVSDKDQSPKTTGTPTTNAQSTSLTANTEVKKDGDSLVWNDSFLHEDIEDLHFYVGSPGSEGSKNAVERAPNNAADTESPQDGNAMSTEKKHRSFDTYSELAGEKLVESEASENQEVGIDDEVSMGAIFRDLEELQDLQKPLEIAEAKFNPPPPPPPPPVKMRKSVQLPPLPPPQPHPTQNKPSKETEPTKEDLDLEQEDRYAVEDKQLLEEQLQLEQDRYSVEETQATKENLQLEQKLNRYSVEEETSVAHPAMTKMQSLEKKYHKMAPSENAISEETDPERRRSMEDPPGLVATTQQEGQEAEENIEKPSVAIFVSHDNAEKTAEDVIRISYPQQSVFDACESVNSSAFGSVRDRELGSDRRQRLAQVISLNAPEDDSIFDGPKSKVSLTRNRPISSGYVTLKNELKRLKTPPCEEVIVNSSVVRVMEDSALPKKVAFDINDDMASFTSVSTQAISVAPFRQQDIFYGCVGENVTKAILKEMDKYIDELEYEEISDDDSSSSSSSADDEESEYMF